MGNPEFNGHSSSLTGYEERGSVVFAHERGNCTLSDTSNSFDGNKARTLPNKEYRFEDILD